MLKLLQIKDIYGKISTTLRTIQNYWNIDFPLKKLDIVAAPGLSVVKPVDNWGLIIFK